VRPDGLQALSLAVADARALPELLARVVTGLAAEPGVALARIWLLADDTLRLAASAGGSIVTSGGVAEQWTRLDGAFSVIPLGQRKVGVVAATGSALLVEDHAQTDPHIARPDWAKREKIRAFCGQPLVFRGQVLGVLAVFSRQAIDATAAGWLRTFADHAAVAIANARAFEQLEQLRGALEQERDDLRAELATGAAGPLIGPSAALAEVRRRIELVAPTDATVLVLGESGTGKELVATAIHEASARRAQPIVRVNCAAIPAELFESEFFGHVKGAFTGALRDRAGKVQLAHRGTLFLDEVAEIPLALQPKLLRVLQERAFERVGDEQTRTADVRFVAATNRDLGAEVRAGRFREDLYYRLAVFPIEIAPLRARPEDIAPLARRFVDAACARFGRAPLPLRPSDVALLAAQRWPGNVRELMSFIERAVILSDKTRLRLDLAFAESPGVPTTPSPAARGFVTVREWRARERDNVRAALAAADGRIYGPRGAAELLGVKPTTLASRLKALGIARAPKRA
jgi:transcriptional regulator with GAF, ATPase, and Fis domain